VRKAAPTRNLEYGAYAPSLAVVEISHEGARNRHGVPSIAAWMSRSRSVGEKVGSSAGMVTVGGRADQTTMGDPVIVSTVL
jgi:hypothetical protein